MLVKQSVKRSVHLWILNNHSRIFASAFRYQTRRPPNRAARSFGLGWRVTQSVANPSGPVCPSRAKVVTKDQNSRNHAADHRNEIDQRGVGAIDHARLAVIKEEVLGEIEDQQGHESHRVAGRRSGAAWPMRTRWDAAARRVHPAGKVDPG